MVLLVWILNQPLEFNLLRKLLMYKIRLLKIKYGILQDNKDLERSLMHIIEVQLEPLLLLILQNQKPFKMFKNG
jgi:hypothetical protein